jgi:hypothetical protein
MAVIMPLAAYFCMILTELADSNVITSIKSVITLTPGRAQNLEKETGDMVLKFLFFITDY